MTASESSATTPRPAIITSDLPADAPHIVLSRLIDAPPELVYRLWTDPRHVVQWWGPTGFTTTNLEMDVRPGGRWRYIMHGPDGVDYPNRVSYQEVAPGERLVYDHDDDSDIDPQGFHVTVTFANEGGKTRLTMVSNFGSMEARAAVLEFGAVDGGKQTTDRLAVYVAGYLSGRRE